MILLIMLIALLTLDSLDLSLNFVTDSVNSSSIFYLHYYPNAVDSVFSQTKLTI